MRNEGSGLIAHETDVDFSLNILPFLCRPQGGLSQSNFYSAQLHEMVAYHDFEGITIHAEEGPRVLASIGTKPAVILRNHGLLSWGHNAPRRTGWR